MSIDLAALTPVQLTFTKSGGAKISVRFAVFRDPQTPTQERVRLVFMGGATTATETELLEGLPPGNYQIVGLAVVEEAVSGTFKYQATINGKQFAKREGDVNLSSSIDVDSFVHRRDLTVA